MVELDFLTKFKEWAYLKEDEEELFYEKLSALKYVNGKVYFDEID